MNDDRVTEPDAGASAPGPAGPDSELSPAAAELGAEIADAVSQAEQAEAAFEHDLHDVEALVRERDDLLALSRRLQADFENYKKRMLREQTAVVERATESLVEQLLPVLDSFEAAFGQFDGDAETDAEKVHKGIEMVHSQLRDVLVRAGLEQVDAEGVDFDPNIHEAIMQEEGDGEPVVGQVIRAGYRLKGRVLRPVMVKVSHTGS